MASHRGFRRKRRRGLRVVQGHGTPAAPACGSASVKLPAAAPDPADPVGASARCVAASIRRPSQRLTAGPVDKENSPALEMWPRGPGRRLGGTSNGQGDQSQSRGNTGAVKTAVTISAEAYRRLRAACAAEGLEQGEVIELLINRHLAGYVVQIRGERVVPGDGKDRLESEGQVNRASSTAA